MRGPTIGQAYAVLLILRPYSRRVRLALLGETHFAVSCIPGNTLTTFESLNLIEPLNQALAANNYINPTPIQAQAIPALLAGRDVVGCAQTGTGKTAAFALPILQHIANSPQTGKPQIRALILSPTRELASQISASFENYGRNLKVYQVVIFGGVSERPQKEELRRGVDIVVATPGRLLDLMNQGVVDLSNVEYFVLDEADRMLDMGFVPDVRRILKAIPERRQNLLFSATMPKAVVELANSMLTNPLKIEITPDAPTVDKIDQSVMFVAKSDKSRLLAEMLEREDFDQAIVFTRTKHGADRVHRRLDKQGFSAAVIHGDRSQGQRERALDAFRAGKCDILIATDIAARGIDVDTITHVFNLDLPNEPENYVHRIGRTGRAGRSGIAISFCDETEGSHLRSIEKTIGQPISMRVDHDFHLESAIPPQSTSGGRSGGGGGGGGNRGNRSRRGGRR